MAYDNKNSGVLFKNDKRGNESAPDYTGKFEDSAGKEWRLAAWLKRSQKGTEFMSLKASEPQARQERNDPAQQGPLDGGSPFTDDIPFAPER